MTSLWTFVRGLEKFGKGRVQEEHFAPQAKV